MASVVVVSIATAIGWFVLGHGWLTEVVMVYLLGVVVVSMRFGYVPSLVVAGLSVAAYDFFFTRPYLNFAVEDRHDLLTFAVMLFVALVISNLTERIRRHAIAAEERELRTAKLYAMSRELSVARSLDDMMRVASAHLHDVFACEVAVLLPDAGGALRAANLGAFALAPEDVPTAAWVFARGEPAGLGASTVASAEVRFVPLRAPSAIVGVVCLRPAARARFEDAMQRELLDTFASQIAHAVERARLADDAQRAQLDVQTERLRNALLSSVSHDLRTPLAVVKGAATALLEGEDQLPAERRHEYLETISDEASRLNRLVRNLLDMTSLEAGALRVHKEWQSIEEVVGVALERIDERLRDRPVELRVPADLPLVPFDATLVEQVLINLVENATKYTPPESGIEIAARYRDGAVEVEVADRGPGVPNGQEELVFEKFHRASKRAGGMGLGLTICRGIVTAHGGQIVCENREHGGAAFRFSLPCDPASAPQSRLPELVSEA